MPEPVLRRANIGEIYLKRCYGKKKLIETTKEGKKELKAVHSKEVIIILVDVSGGMRGLVGNNGTQL